MTRKELEDAAAAAHDLAEERSAKLDERENELSGKIADMEREIIDLNSKVKKERDEIAWLTGELNVANQRFRSQRNDEAVRNVVLQKQLNAETERAERALDGLRIEWKKQDELKVEMCRVACERDELKRTVEDHLETMTDLAAERDELRERLAEAIERTQAEITYSAITVELLGGIDKRTIDRKARNDAR